MKDNEAADAATSFFASLLINMMKGLSGTITPSGFLSVFLVLALLPLYCQAFSLSMMSKSAADIANFAVRQSPSSTRFVTNKMCPFAQKAWIALELAQAPYEMEEVSLYGANGKPDWFWELNEAGTVPVLVCYGGAVVLPDSDLILDQLVQGGVVEGGNVLQSSNDGMEELVQEFRRRIKDMLPVGKDVVLGKRKEKLMSMLRDMDEHVVGPFLCGDKPTLADCAAFPFLWRLNEEFGPLEEQGCGKIQEWLKTCGETEAFSKTIQASWWWWW